MKIVVADASPIITFSRAGKLKLLKSLLSEIIVPEAVYNEIVKQGKDKPGAVEVFEADWIIVKKIKNRKDIESLPKVLGEGEKEAILLASELNCTILLDERRARIEAKAKGLKIISSLTVLLQAKKLGKIKKVKTIMDEFIRTGFRVNSKIYKEILNRAKEL